MKEPQFTHLSLPDLLEARDLYHAHLINKKNVVATAVGRYRIRHDDRWPSAEEPRTGRAKGPKAPRTLENSEVRPYSWPCIHVFVSKWEEDSALIADGTSELVPKAIYLPDGRVVPICLIWAPTGPAQEESVDPARLTFPKNVIGGGFPVIAQVQGEERIASLGCIVSDGHKAYALTNRHVVGTPGSPLFSRLAGEPTRIGQSAERQLGKIAFVDAYPGWKGSNIVINADVGLIDIDNVRQWKTEVFGVGAYGDLLDLNVFNLSLDLIDSLDNPKPVRAFGAVSGKLAGTVAALFYRYKSVGGTEYVADFLIAPPSGCKLATHHGDSGTIWLMETKEEFRPFALQWGAHRFLDDGKAQTSNYALATCLSTVCRALDVDLVRGWNRDLGYTWGKTGHFKIAARACELVSNQNLSKLMMANQRNIGYVDDDLLNNQVVAGKFTHDFVPLADVADIIWRTTRPDDESNHFADIDETDPSVFGGKSLLELCLSDQKNIDIDVWVDFDRRMDAVRPNMHKNRETGEMELRPRAGALPFRVWQMYVQMIASLRSNKPPAEKIAEFVCAAGTMAHYVGDACQPLHVSYLHHGRNASEAAVHSDYETGLIDKKMRDLFKGINDIENKVEPDELIQAHEAQGKDAALLVLKLMDETVKRLPPLEVVEVWAGAKGFGKTEKMWGALGERTIQNIASGCHTLAVLWESAWKVGGGDKISDEALVECDQQALMDLYNNKKFVPSYVLMDGRFKALLK